MISASDVLALFTISKPECSIASVAVEQNGAAIPSNQHEYARLKLATRTTFGVRTITHLDAAIELKYSMTV